MAANYWPLLLRIEHLKTALRYVAISSIKTIFPKPPATIRCVASLELAQQWATLTSSRLPKEWGFCEWMTMSLDQNGYESTLTVKQLAKILNIHRVSVYRLCETTPSFPRGFKLGKNRRWLLSEVNAWVLARSAAARKN